MPSGPRSNVPATAAGQINRSQLVRGAWQRTRAVRSLEPMPTLFIALGAVALAYVVAVITLVVAGRRTAAREVAMLLPNMAMLFKGLIGDPRVPPSSKFLLLFGIVWVASPIDLLPEFLPFLGPLDDAVVVALILRRLGRTAGRQVIEEHWRGDPAIIARLCGPIKGPAADASKLSRALRDRPDRPTRKGARPPCRRTRWRRPLARVARSSAG